MSDVVDKVLGGEMSPESENHGAPTGSEQGEQYTPRADQRIQELISERETLKRQYFEETGQLKQELEDLRSRVGNVENKSDNPVTSWADLSDTQLRSVMKESLDNPDMQISAMEEMARRVAEKKVSEYRDIHEKDQTKQTYKQQVYQQIVKDFGQEAADHSSDLYKKADAHYAQLRAAYQQMHGAREGDRILESNPEAEYACFAKAAAETWAPQRDELSRLRGEVEKFKQVGSMAIGRSAATQPPDSVKEALKKGDWRTAIKKLPIIPA